MHGRVTGAVLVIALAGLNGCAHDVATSSEPNASEHSARPRLAARFDGSLTLDPAVARPGEIVALRFPDHRTRGIPYTLESDSADGWKLAYFLMATNRLDETAPPDWWSVDDAEGKAWADVGFGGPGPEWVSVPDVATSGTNRLCTEMSRKPACF